MPPNAPEVKDAIQPIFIDLFAGLGGMRIAFERNNCTCAFSSEIDRDAASSYKAFFGVEPDGDITKIQSSQIPDHDILVGGFPCQAFSIAGAQKGFADIRGTLFFEIMRILEAKRPVAFLLENVKNLRSHDNGKTFEIILGKLRSIGYSVHWRILNALDYDLPQRRERVIIVGFRVNVQFSWPSPRKLTNSLDSILEPESKIEKKHFVSPRIRENVVLRLEGKKLPERPWICHENIQGNRSPRTYCCALRAGASHNYLLVNGERRLTPRENLRLQGFPESFPIVVSDSAIRKQCGNSVPIPMIEAVAAQLVAAIKQSKEWKPVISGFRS